MEYESDAMKPQFRSKTNDTNQRTIKLLLIVIFSGFIKSKLTDDDEEGLHHKIHKESACGAGAYILRALFLNNTKQKKKRMGFIINFYENFII